METRLLHPDSASREPRGASLRLPRSLPSAPAAPRLGPGSAGLPAPWHWVEAWFQRAYAIHPVSDAPDCLIAYNRGVHQGPEVRLQCGAVIRRGDAVAEIHFRREALLPLTGQDPARVAIQMLKWADRDFPLLARRLDAAPELADVRALHALSLFHGATARYGFEVRPIPERHLEWWFTAWQRLLLRRDHHAGGGHARQMAAGLTARHIWLSRERLIQRCAERAARGRRETLSGRAR